MSGRLVAVLGYSNGSSALHHICAARLRRAEAEARRGDVVLLSGWARGRARSSEAELMAAAWRGAGEVLVSHDARSTLGNARAAAEAAGTLAPSEVVLVTSSWHQRRAAALFRAALHGSRARLVLASADGASPLRVRLRELACWPLVPFQAALARKTTPNRRRHR